MSSFTKRRGLIKRLSVFVMLLVLLSACFQQPSPVTPPAAPQEIPVITDSSLDNATKDEGQAKTLEGTVDDSVGVVMDDPDSGSETTLAPATDLSPQAVLPGSKGYVVYVWNNNSDTTQPWRIYRRNETTDVTTLIYGGLRQVDSVAVSGDGTRILASIRETISASSDFEIYQFDLNPVTVTQLTNNSGADINVSMTANAGKYVWEGDGATAAIRNIVLRDNFVTPATTTTLAPTISSDQPTITGNGKFIALLRRSAVGDFEIYKYELATNVYTFLYALPSARRTISHPSLSDAGDRVAFSEKAITAIGLTQYRIYVRNTLNLTDSAFFKPVINTPAMTDHAYIAAGGDYLTYALQNNGKFAIVTRNLVTKVEASMVDATADLTGPHWQFFDEFAPVSQTIGTAGGALLSGRALIQVPASALSGDVTFTIEKLKTLPAALPNGLQAVGAYKFSSNTTADFTNPIALVTPVDVANTLPANQVITELYVWDAVNSKYEKQQIGDANTGFILEPKKLSSTTFVIGRTTVAAITAQCTAQGGQFNGRYCQLPFSSSGGGALTAQAVGRTYKVLSFNVGNALFGGGDGAGLLYCKRYAVKLCSFATEERVRNAIILDNPDIIAFQEVWHSDCTFVSEPGFVTYSTPAGEITYTQPNDKVCTPNLINASLTQLERLLLDTIAPKFSKYEWRCTLPVQLPNNIIGGPKTINGYECVAIKKDLFEFVGTSPQPIQPPCDVANANPNQNYDGRDTGFQVETVRPKNYVGVVDNATFDIVNAHMIQPFSTCKQVQLGAFRSRYLNQPKRLLALGDFNTNPQDLTDVARSLFRSTFTNFDLPSDVFPYSRLAYLLDNPTEATSLLGSLDHVTSNFADGTCVRIGPTSGTDHLRTLCNLTGFDSANVEFYMLLSNLSTSPTLNYLPRNGIVTPVKKGVKLLYAKVENGGTIGANLAEGRHRIIGLPSDVTFFIDTKACTAGTTRNLNFLLPPLPTTGFNYNLLVPGESRGLPIQRFLEVGTTAGC